MKKPLGLLSINSLVFSRDNRYVSLSISANQTSAPTNLAQLADAAKVIEVVIILSPPFNPKAIAPI
ncbi:hypothetical protein D3C84_1279030 [compost metagenome]